MNEDDEITVKIIEKGKELCEEFDLEKAFNNHSLVQIGLSVPFFGAYLGVRLQGQFLNG